MLMPGLLDRGELGVVQVAEADAGNGGAESGCQLGDVQNDLRRLRGTAIIVGRGGFVSIEQGTAPAQDRQVDVSGAVVPAGAEFDKVRTEVHADRFESRQRLVGIGL